MAQLYEDSRHVTWQMDVNKFRTKPDLGFDEEPKR